MNITIRKGKPADIPQALELVRELARYEKAPQEVTNTEEDMLRDGFGDQPCFRLVVAETEKEIAGIAIYFVKYSTWKGKGVYLDDIVVKEPLRGKGIGKMLFDAVIADCRALNANQLHWQVLNWNEPAIGFYKKYSASFDEEWINCKMNRDQINQYEP